MTNLISRIGKLEASNGNGLEQVTASVREAFKPSVDGPVSCGVCHIRVFGSDQSFSCEDFDTEVDLIAAADAEHRRIHGQPLQRSEKVMA